MLKKNLLPFIFLISTLIANAQSTSIPFLKNKQLWVDDKPFMIIGGELHNSTASSVAYMEQENIWPKLQSLNVNTVLATISWEQFEPTEGVFDYQLIDYLISNAEKNNFKMVVVWFASWKNGQSSYAPSWVKENTSRFPRVKTKDGKNIETLSVFSEETMKADAKSFSRLLKRIKEVDRNNTVIMVQPENEVGIFQDIDYQQEALDKYNDEVPLQLMTYLQKNKENLMEEVKTLWQATKYKTSGTWKEVFGDNPQSKELFMAWHYASFINYVAEVGRKEHNLPMFVNAWIVQKPDDLPGIYPNGGPVSRVMDIYKAAAPSIDIVSPDIYLPNYKEIYAMYDRADNPLLVPESTMDAGRAFYAFAEHNAICYSPFGIESGAGDVLFSKSYEVLNELMPVITKYQGSGKMRGIHLSREEQDQEFTIEGVSISLKIQNPDEAAFGLIIKADENEFIVAGMNFKVTFGGGNKNQIYYVQKVTEGQYIEGNWFEGRWLNGDETYHHELVRVLGRKVDLDAQFKRLQTKLDVGDDEQFVYTPGSVNRIDTPGIYKIKLYQREE
jgi:hypothetical protein